MVSEVVWTNLASITTDTCPFGPILANHYSEVQFNLFFSMNNDPLISNFPSVLSLYDLNVSTKFRTINKKKKELGQVTNPVSFRP